MEELETSYEAKRDKYKALIASNDPTKVSEIQTLNGELADILHRMAEKLTAVKSSAAGLTMYRDDILQQLVEIQNDSSILREQRDQYETLRMLQTQDQTVFRSTFFWYALALGFVAVAFLVALMWKGGYSAPTIPTTISNPNTMADLT